MLILIIFDVKYPCIRYYKKCQKCVNFKVPLKMYTTKKQNVKIFTKILNIRIMYCAQNLAHFILGI